MTTPQNLLILMTLSLTNMKKTLILAALILCSYTTAHAQFTNETMPDCPVGYICTPIAPACPVGYVCTPISTVSTSTDIIATASEPTTTPITVVQPVLPMCPSGNEVSNPNMIFMRYYEAQEGDFVSRFESIYKCIPQSLNW